MVDRRQLRLIKNNRRKEQPRKTAEVTPLSLLDITPAEAVEMARFRALTKAKARRQQVISRLSAELGEPPDVPPAA